ncbi:MAG TPA: sulfite exporter TauE/SafE family protein [Thermoanaerobaculia bacterium]|nr:sulfite exporter TauE/SafE family protein [Thermoanaerobaculia bacterium]
MPDAKTLLFLALGAVCVVFCVAWIRSARRSGEPARPGPVALAIGFMTNFFDTLGIGSFAPTTSVWKLKGIVRDEKIPGTLNVGHAFPTITQAFIFIAIVQVEMTTLIGMIAASVAGAWLGAGLVSAWPRRRVQAGMGIALFAAACFFAMTNLKLFPAGGDTLGLASPLLWAGLAGNFALGALMTLGIGLYAPCMILVALLGMNPRAAFPIMMGSCAFLMPIGGLRFIARGSYNLRAAVGLTIGGVPAVLLAAFVVKSLPLSALRWLVFAVVLYTAVAMLVSARRKEADVPV